MEIKNQKIHNYIFIKIYIAFNNVFITVTDTKGNVLLQKSSGMLKFKGRKKRNPFSASEVVKSLLKGLKQSTIKFKGIIIERQSHRFREIRSVIKSISEFKYMEWYKKKDKKSNKKKHVNKALNLDSQALPVFYIKRVRLKSHNGMRKRKPRRK